ncbi:MAG: SDR family oxidoreductase [Paraperlucidibaca sp.]
MSYRSAFRADLFAGQTHIVTGGGSGIGRCCAHELASLGANVMLIGRNVERLEATQAEIIADGGKACFYSVDIRQELDVRDTVAKIVTEHGQIHGLVNNAGGQFPAPLMHISKNGWDAVVNSNLTGGFLMSREVMNQSMHEHGGAIVNIIADMWRGMPNMGHSGAARAGMLSFTETAAVEWASFGVRVNAVAPGFIASSGMDRYDPSFAEYVVPQMRGTIPSSRMGDEDEVSSAIIFLLSPAASYTTGACLCVDGGSSLNTKLFTLHEHDRMPEQKAFHRAVKPAAVQRLMKK